MCGGGREVKEAEKRGAQALERNTGLVGCKLDNSRPWRPLGQWADGARRLEIKTGYRCFVGGR